MCVIVDNEVGGFFGFVVNMLCSVHVPPQCYRNVCSSMQKAWGKFRNKELGHFEFMSVNLNWPQEVELEFELE